MTSCMKKTKLIRGRKARSNKVNQKTNKKRIQDNLEVLKELASKDKS